MLILNQWRRSLRVRVMQIRPIQSSCYEREKRQGREREKIIAPRWNERETRREDRRENTERERISNNRVSTIKANPPATLIMVCRIDLSRSPSQRHPIPVSAPSLGRSKPPRELIPVKSLIRGGEEALRPFYGRDFGSRAKHVLRGDPDADTDTRIIFDVVEKIQAVERTRRREEFTS